MKINSKAKDTPRMQANVRAGWESRFKSATGVRLDGLGSRIDGSVNPILDRYLRLKDAVTKRA
jgi:hypothetical protein